MKYHHTVPCPALPFGEGSSITFVFDKQLISGVVEEIFTVPFTEGFIEIRCKASTPMERYFYIPVDRIRFYVDLTSREQKFSKFNSDYLFTR